MDIYQAIYSRRTVRDFLAKEIDADIVKKFIDAGLHAPSNDHMRNWEFIIVNDKAARLAVIEKINKNRTEKDALNIINELGLSDEYQRSMYIDAIPKQYRMLLEAGCLIIPCFRQTTALLAPESLSSLNGFASIWCCIENILLAATAEGICGVTRIPFDEEIAHIKEVLNIPGDYEIPCYIALGYPAGNKTAFRQHIVNTESHMHLNRW